MRISFSLLNWNHIHAYSLAASTTVAAKSLFGVYVWTGLAIMLVPCIEIAWAHPAFLVIVYWSLASSVIWIGVHIWRFAKVKTA